MLRSYSLDVVEMRWVWDILHLAFANSRAIEWYYRSGYADCQSPGAVSHSYRFSEANKETISRYQSLFLDVHIPTAMLLEKKILDDGCANGFFLDFCAGQGCLKENLFGFDIAEDLLASVGKKGYRHA